MGKSALFCEHANESPLYEREGERLVCRCPEDCYCKDEGGCKGLRRETVSLGQIPTTLREGHCALFVEGKLVAHCTSEASLEAVRRLFSL